jgi:hypothetical protein
VNAAFAASSMLGNFAGWIIFGASFLLPLVAREIRRDHRVALVFWCSLLLRQVFALSTGFLSGPYSDANWFHEWAIVRARELGLSGVKLTVGGEFYERLLGAAYDVLGTSPFLAAELSVLAFSASMIVFSNILRDLGITRHRAGLLALYSLPFSALYFTSTILREAFQLLGFVLAIQFALRYRRTGSPVALVPSCLSVFVMGLFHDGLVIFSAFFVVLVILWPVGSQREHGTMTSNALRSYRLVRRLGVAIVLLVIAIGGTRLITRGLGSGALAAILSQRAFEFAARYREGGLRVQARTNYDVRLDTSSPAAFAMSAARVFIYYLFSPFPWQVRGPADVLGASEVILRFLLLAFALRELWRSEGAERRTRAFLLVAYFSLAGLWSLGTVNYGTAYRHHVTTNWLLILLGGPQLLDAGGRLLRTLLGRRALVRA